jgi:ribosomal protein S18 acetylase RimI-like enzyme
MLYSIKNGETVYVRQVLAADLSALSAYLYGLSAATRQRFAPHGSSVEHLQELFASTGINGYLAHETKTAGIVGYALVKTGYLEHDQPRLAAYGLSLHALTDATYAPSVADAWQGMGVGQALLDHIVQHLQKSHFQRLILWGGVQKNNLPAVGYYLKNGFVTLGQFEYRGENLDMMLTLRLHRADTQ